MMTYGSLFSGVGCFDLAFCRAGWTPLWHCEIDPECRRVLRHHWPDVPIYEDVRSLDGAALPVPDCIVGGFPCQDVSSSGRRSGLAGERSGLWREFRRVLAELAPRWCLVENVVGLLSSDRGRDLGALLWQLGELGYWWAYRRLDSRHDGMAQRRERVFIVGNRGEGGFALPARVLFERGSVSRDPPPCQEEADTIVAAGDGGVGDGGGRRNVVEAWQCHGGSVGRLGTIRRGNGSVTGGVPFLVSESPPRVRAMTPTEGLRMFGLPDWWLDVSPPLRDSQKWKMMGNGGAVPTVQWIAGRILSADRGELLEGV